MSGEDWSDYSSDDPEYEISDHSEMSDSDGSYSDTDDDEDNPTVSFNNWNVLSDPFADKIPRPLQDFSADYDFHPAIDFQECKDPVNCFEHFMSPNIVAKLCEWTNKRAEICKLPRIAKYQKSKTIRLLERTSKRCVTKPAIIILKETGLEKEIHIPEEHGQKEDKEEKLHTANERSPRKYSSEKQPKEIINSKAKKPTNEYREAREDSPDEEKRHAASRKKLPFF
ncbi:hypothetical protein FQA39_LY15572 [Lamprigera yunnana]|nr:hypothetical protein FQA39_LY15572 [Lamprigera yunnana]